MANLITLREQILKFLQDPTPKVMAIKGDWGVGKTCAWNNTLEEVAKEKGNENTEESEEKFKHEINENFNSYSYVSLFGIESIDKLKAAIFEKSVDKKSIGEEISVKAFLENKKSLLKLLSKRIAPVVKSVSSEFGFGGIAGQAISYLPTISYLSVKNTIICLDDLERTKLDAHEVLGLISELKEEKKCKIVLIFNENKLPDDNGFTKEKYAKYREKVVDIEVKFEPESKECVFICFRGQDDSAVDDYTILKNTCCLLNITNIRIMNKIIQLWKELPDLDKESFGIVKDRIALTLVFLSDLFYAPNTSQEEEALGKKLDVFLNGISEFSILFPYHLKGTKNLDREILFAVENGYFKEHDLNNSIKKYIADFKEHKQNIEKDSEYKKVYDNHEKAWGMLHSCFSEEGIIDNLYKATLEYVTKFPENLNIDTLNGNISFLREYSERSDEIDKLIELYVKSRTDGGYQRMKELSGVVNFDSILKEEVLAKQKNETESISLDEILSYLSANSSCSDEYKLVIDNSSQEDYYDAFKKIDNRQMYTAINHCFAFANDTGRENINKALDKLAEEGDLGFNKFRVDNIRRKT